MRTMFELIDNVNDLCLTIYSIKGSHGALCFFVLFPVFEFCTVAKPLPN